MVGDNEHKGNQEDLDGSEVGDEPTDFLDPAGGGEGTPVDVETPPAPTGLEDDVEPERREALEDPAQRLAEELDSLNDRHLRLAAEFENFRKRTRREQTELTSVAQAALARRLLPTLDDLARVAATPSDATTVEALEEGVGLILINLLKELEEAGLSRVDALGARFDPEEHQAIMTAETEDPDRDDIVSRVFVDGYLFRGRLIRPAQVEVLTHEPETVGEP